jgi:subfamily B ATP-binding cassette protein HlyB/CyaB
LSRIARHYGINANAASLGHELALGRRSAGPREIERAARLLGMRARTYRDQDVQRLNEAPRPLIVGLKDGAFGVLRASPAGDKLALAGRGPAALISPEALIAIWNGTFVLAAPDHEPLENGDRLDWAWLAGVIWRYRKPLAHVLLLSFFVQIFALVTPLFFQIIIDKVLVHHATDTLLLVTGSLALLGFFDVVLQQLRTYTLAHTSSRIDVELGSQAYSKLLGLPISYFETSPAGQTVARIRELENIRSFLTGQGLISAVDAFFFFVYLAVLFLYSVQLTLIVLATIPLYVTIVTVVRPLLRRRIEERFQRGAASQQLLVESVVGAGTLKAAAAEPWARRLWEERLALYVSSAFRSLITSSAGQNGIQYVTKLSTVLVLYFGAQRVFAGDMTVGALVAFNMISNQAVTPVLRLSNLWQDFQQVQVSVERLGDIMNRPSEPIGMAQAKLPPLSGRIEFDRVTFRYHPASPPVLRDLSLTVVPGEFLGVVGPSGSGKSTLAKLIQRLYLADEGRVMLDGRLVMTLPPAWLRRQIGVVLQENLLFNRTIHENIALAAPNLSRQRVIEIARLAGADEFISMLPEGYDTRVQERGANFSGGQRQRIAIARALARDPRILIFDEATSALDYETEQVIQQNMRQIARGRTVIVIAHRLAAIRGCDRIVSIEQGRITETGTHQELVTAGGLYSRLWHLQSAVQPA